MGGYFVTQNPELLTQFLFYAICPFLAAKLVKLIVPPPKMNAPKAKYKIIIMW